jgi:hypothetical protein
MATTPIPLQQRIELVEAVLELLMVQAAAADHRPGFDAQRRLKEIYKAWDDRYEDLLFLRLERSLEAAS